MRPAEVLAGGVLAMGILMSGAHADSPGTSAGKDVFARRCSGCHALDNTKEGPRLRGVFGRKSASLPDFNYSDSVRKLGVTWDATNLDRWLIDPDAMAPDTDMSFKLRSADERKAVIEFLKNFGTK